MRAVTSLARICVLMADTQLLDYTFVYGGYPIDVDTFLSDGIDRCFGP